MAASIKHLKIKSCYAGPSDQVETFLTELVIISTSMLRYTRTVFFECARLSSAITTKCNMPLHQEAAVK